MKPGAVSAEGYVEAEWELGHDEGCIRNTNKGANGHRPRLVDARCKRVCSGLGVVS
jgi:hypothetical protein